MSLPAELIDRVFSFLRNDPSALQACSKAHPSYSRLAERYLYTDIVINPAGASELHKQLSEKSRLLYPRTLLIYGDFSCQPPIVLSILRMIPQMANLMSLTINDSNVPCPFDQYGEFISTFRNCLEQSSIEQLYLSFLHEFPLSVLDNGKNIKKLTLDDSTAKEEPISSLPSSQQSLETLILSGKHSPELHFWAMHRVAHLTSLGLQDLLLGLDWTVFPGLLTACSNSLTRLDFDCSNTWINSGPQFPFTFSALIHLKNLSIFALITSTATRIDCPLPEIVRLIETAPAIQHVFLSLHYQGSGCITSFDQLDWSLLDRLQSNFTGTHPRVDLCITGGFSISRKSILDALAGTEVLMDLVKRGLVILNSEPPSALWEES